MVDNLRQCPSLNTVVDKVYIYYIYIYIYNIGLKLLAAPVSKLSSFLYIYNYFCYRQEAEMKNQMLSQILDQAARARRK